MGLRTEAPPSLSVVIPVLDDAVLLRRCLECLARQTLAPLEVVVVDNGCRDDSVAVALAARARVVAEPRRGIPAAAATGYDAARGEVIVRCDADTLAPPDWLERIAGHLSEPEVDAVTGSGTFYATRPLTAATAGRLYLGSYYVTMYAAMARPPLWGSNMAVRRTLWQSVRDRVHRDDPEVHDDVDLSMVLGPAARVRYDRGLVVRVSGRSLHGRAQLRRRFMRAFRTLRLNWALMPPWERWRRRLTADG